MHQRKAASVLRLPVGADIRVCWPAATERQPPSWTSVGAEKAPENQARAAGENRSRTVGMDFSLCPAICPSNPREIGLGLALGAAVDMFSLRGRALGYVTAGCILVDFIFLLITPDPLALPGIDSSKRKNHHQNHPETALT